MNTRKTDYHHIVDALIKELRPLMCLVVPRLTEEVLLITVSNRLSDQYFSCPKEISTLACPVQRAIYTAEIRAFFNIEP
ncbi:hypothetical protein AR540_23750 [Pseudomonas sp. EpS/L25]|nr:hypothetical protein AR540_23750 [Pseudomonas sp. EpS/L25]